MAYQVWHLLQINSRGFQSIALCHRSSSRLLFLPRWPTIPISPLLSVGLPRAVQRPDRLGMAGKALLFCRRQFTGMTSNLNVDGTRLERNSRCLLKDESLSERPRTPQSSSTE